MAARTLPGAGALRACGDGPKVQRQCVLPSAPAAAALRPVRAEHADAPTGPLPFGLMVRYPAEAEACAEHG
ncbi:hypothetical protein EDD38_5460 [Kitasatospora cineracea]|uniref:Uncharacterized protein n=1 Tax=Kitasatospora cineracea TaxID=88074 RepID=A0A3N4SKJ4_9ACTN|nr:hypothetical protein EDD38_5460 [Kitasatospora cineracea]